MVRAIARRVHVVVAAVVLAALVTGLVAPWSGARAVSILWTLTASPLTATTGVQRVFTLTAMNEDPLSALDSNKEIGCVVVDVPGNFTVQAAVVTGSNAGEQWHVDSIVGNRAIVHTDSGGERLALLQWVRFTITATPFNTGSLTWNARAFRQQDCTGGAAVIGIPPIVVVTGPPITPTPEPTPVPTPVPTPKPTPTPTPRPSPTPRPLPSLPVALPSLPLPLPSFGPPPSAPDPEPTRPPTSSAPRPTPDQSASKPDEPDEPGSGSDDGDATGPPSNGSGGGGGGVGDSAPANPVANDAPTVAFDEPRLDLGSLDIDLLAGVEIWSVPAATLGVPGILLIVWVALQAVGALAWIPAVKRLRGEDEPEPSLAVRRAESD